MPDGTQTDEFTHARTVAEARERGAIVPIARQGSAYLPAFSDAGQMMEFAALMSRAGVMVGPACRGNIGACLATTMIAGRFGLDPFMLSTKAYIVTNQQGVETLAWEAQAINAMLLGSGELEAPLDYEYEGEGQQRRVIVTGRLKGRTKDQSVRTNTLAEVAHKSPLWKKEPDQQLAYYGSRLWARRHAPHILMGIYSQDEADTIVNVTPSPEEDAASRLTRSLKGEPKAEAGENNPATPQDAEIIEPEPETKDREPESPPSETEPPASDETGYDAMFRTSPSNEGEKINTGAPQGDLLGESDPPAPPPPTPAPPPQPPKAPPARLAGANAKAAIAWAESFAAWYVGLSTIDRDRASSDYDAPFREACEISTKAEAILMEAINAPEVEEG